MALASPIMAGQDVTTLERALIETTIPVQDLERARTFYTQKLGLTPTSEGPIGLRFRLAEGTRFRLFRSGGRASGAHTQMAIMVDDLVAAVDELRARGVQFEEYESPGLKTTDGIADLGYARAAWFKDSEGNMIGIAQQAVS
jgi:catechol 2,3-dioxygenase-like lactoylglutathione lyase family enzyme